MKKALVIILCMVLAVSMTACSAKPPKGIVTLRIGNSTTVCYLGTDAEAAAVGIAVNSGQLGSSGEKGVVVIAGTAYADNAAAGCGSFAVAYEITIP